MRISLSGRRKQLFRSVAIIAVLAGLGAGCSSDYTRNDMSLYKNSIEAEQDLYGSSSNPYPDNLDTTTTSSVDGRYDPRRPKPSSSISSQPELQQYGADTGQGAKRNSGYSPYQNARTSTAADDNGPIVIRSDIDQQELPPVSGRGNEYNDGSREISRAAHSTGDRGDGGWSSAGGTSIKLQQGETLYNLSKRYGVPVSAVMEANGIRDASQVQAGQTIVIPTYVYSRNAPVSAPDNNPGTRFASASRGSSVEPDIRSVPAPQWRPNNFAGNSRSNEAQPARQVADSRSRAGGSGTQVASAEPGRDVDRIETSSASRNDAVDSGSDATVRQAAINRDAPEQTGIGQFRWPVRGRVISSYGEKTHAGRNDGIDISVPEGTAVKAAENGVVVYAGDELEGFGNLLLVRHSDGWVSAYAHNKALEVSRGDEVRRGQIIARSGRTGNAEMPKLHFELRKDSTPVDPLKHLGGA